MHTGWCNFSNFCYHNLNLNIVFFFFFFFYYITIFCSPGQTVFLNLYLVTLVCPTLCEPMGCSPTGSFVHGDSPGNNTRVGCHTLFQEIFPTQGLNPGLLYWRKILYQWSQQGSLFLNCNLFIAFHALCWR